MKKFYYLIVALLFFNFSFSQNSEIKIANGSLVPSPYYYCTAPTLNLEVKDYFSTSSTTSTTVNASAYNPIFSDATGEQNVVFRVGVTPENEFSEAIELGFDFTFFDKTYTHMVVGSNGRLVFAEKAVLDNLNGKTDYIDRTFSGNRLPLQENPLPAPITPITPGIPIPSTKYNRIYSTGDVDRELKMAQIFAGYTKLKVNSPTGNYKYKKGNLDPNDPNSEKFILITFQNVIPTKGVLGPFGDEKFTSRIILFSDGRVILNVKDKADQPYNAILGMQNEDGNVSIIPTHGIGFNYNNQNWPSESSTAYVIKTGLTRNPTYLWELDRNNGGPIETSVGRFFPNYSPTYDVEKLSVKISFAEAGVPAINSVVEFRKVRTPVIEKRILGCNIILNVLSPDPGLTYKWYREGDASSLFTGTELILNSTFSSDKYYAVPIKPDGTSCTGSNKIEIKKFFPPAVIKNQLVVCDNTASPASSTIVNLYTEFYPQYSAPSSFEEYDVDFFDSNGLVTNPANYEVPKNTDVSITIRRKLRSQPLPYCETDIVKINFVSVPNTFNIPVCFSTTSFDLKNNFEARFPNAGYNYTFTYSDGSSVEDSSAVDVTRVVNVKTSVLPSPTCSTNTIVTFTPGSTISVPSIPMQERCKGSDNNANRFDFNYIKTLLDPTNQYDIKFFIKSNNTEIVPVSPAPTSGANLNNAGYFWSDTTGDYIIYAKLSNPSDPTCFAISDDIILRVYTPPTARSDYHSKLKSRACGRIIVNLEITNVFDLIATNSHGQIPTIKYFDQSGNQLFGSDVTDYNISRGIPYIEIQNGNCLPPLNLNYEIISEVFPLSDPAPEVICDDFDGNVDGKIKVKIASDLFKNNFTSEFARATFNYFDGAYLIHTSNTLNDNFEYEITDNKTITVKVFSDQYCENSSTINFKVNNPTAVQISGNVNLCFNENLELNIENITDFNSLQWLDPNGNPIATSNPISIKYQEVLFGKAYKVIGTNANGCISEISFTPSDENQPKIKVINQTNNSIEVIAEGGVMYYFNGVPQSSNILQNPTASSYKIQVESATGCLGEPKTIYFIKINNAFTPNGDGKNDVWKIENLDRMEQVSIVIADRNGTKVFESNNPSKTEWDGKHNNRALPTSTYWYVVSWYDPVTLKSEQRQGWILMKNRN